MVINLKKITIFFILLFIFLLFIGIYIVFFYTIDLGNRYYIYNTSPKYIKLKNNNNFMIADILDYEFNEKYVIARRIPAKFYSCKNRATIIYENKLQYLIIDKVDNKIYTTYNKNNFLLKKNNFLINLKFKSENENKINNKIIKKNNISNNNTEFFKYIEKNCIENILSELIEY